MQMTALQAEVYSVLERAPVGVALGGEEINRQLYRPRRHARDARECLQRLRAKLRRDPTLPQIASVKGQGGGYWLTRPVP